MEKEKAMLAEDLTSYINENHTQEECVGFIDGYNAALTKLKLLGTPDVGQSEQLVCHECGSKDLKTAIHTDYKECNKCYHYWES